MRKLCLMLFVVVLCGAVAQADTIMFSPHHLADGTHDVSNGYHSVATAALESVSPSWNGSAYSTPWIASDFSDSENARMLVLNFRDLFGPGAIQIPVGSVITSASLNVNIWTGYKAPATEIRAFTGLTPIKSTLFGLDADFSTAAWQQHGAGVAWDGGSTADEPVKGVDYSTSYVAAPITATQGSGVYSVDQYVSFDVTADVVAYAAGSLDNNGWWIGTNQAEALGRFQAGGGNAGWVLTPDLVVTFTPIPEPMTLTLLGLGSLALLRRKR